jgi:23S rRNA pseudouridine1911/1915/1917 synthase
MAPPAETSGGPEGNDVGAGLDEGAFDTGDDVDAEVRERTVDAALHGLRLDKALVAMAPEFSRNHLQGLIERGHVRVDGDVATVASRAVRVGQRLAVELLPTAQARAFRPQPMALVVVHEDDDVLVIDKPAGLVVHPAPGHWSGTLVNGLLARDAGAAVLPRAGIVHRLDKDTSGLMVVARTLPAMTALVRAIAAREVRREYQALVHGDVGAVPFTVDAPIGRDLRLRVRMAVGAHGKAARTDVTPVARALGVSAVWCRLHTGRTHQIRVHLAHRGHPLVADALYGGTPALGVARQALHAARLGFAHPTRGAWLQFERPLPADLAAAWQQVVAAGPRATMATSSE